MSELKPSYEPTPKTGKRYNLLSRPWDSSYIAITEDPNGDWVYDPKNARPAPDVDALARKYAEKFKFQHMKDCFPFGVIDLEKLAKTLKQFAAELRKEE